MAAGKGLPEMTRLTKALFRLACVYLAQLLLWGAIRLARVKGEASWIKAIAAPRFPPY